MFSLDINFPKNLGFKFKCFFLTLKDTQQRFLWNKKWAEMSGKPFNSTRPEFFGDPFVLGKDKTTSDDGGYSP